MRWRREGGEREFCRIGDHATTGSSVLGQQPVDVPQVQLITVVDVPVIVRCQLVQDSGAAAGASVQGIERL